MLPSITTYRVEECALSINAAFLLFSNISLYQLSLTSFPHWHIYHFNFLSLLKKNMNNDEVLKEKIKWSDAFVLLYSVTDVVSFTEMHRLKFLISHTKNNSLKVKVLFVYFDVVLST